MPRRPQLYDDDDLDYDDDYDDYDDYDDDNYEDTQRQHQSSHPTQKTSSSQAPGHRGSSAHATKGSNNATHRSLPAKQPPKTAAVDKAAQDLSRMSVSYEAPSAVALCVVGHVDTGKSTLVGQVLAQTGAVSSSLIQKVQREAKAAGKKAVGYAWILDSSPEERQHGVTADIAISPPVKLPSVEQEVFFIDSPGHMDFLVGLIQGAFLADIALIIVAAGHSRLGELEVTTAAAAGVGGEEDGRPIAKGAQADSLQEQCRILAATGMTDVIVAVTQMDQCDFDQGIFAEITSNLDMIIKLQGLHVHAFVPCSGLSGDNICQSPPSSPLREWYCDFDGNPGPSLMEAIKSLVTKGTIRVRSWPFRAILYDGDGKKSTNGRIISGSAGGKKPGQCWHHPQNCKVDIKKVRGEGGAGSHTSAGAFVELDLNESRACEPGILWDSSAPLSVMTTIRVVLRTFSFQNLLLPGAMLIVHSASGSEEGVLSRISGARALKPRSASALVEITLKQALVFEGVKDHQSDAPLRWNRVVIRQDGRTIASGVVQV